MLKKGIDCKAFYRSGGNYATPTWTEVSIINDLTQNSAANEAEANSRASYVNRMVITGFDLNWTGTMQSDASATWTAIYEAMLENSTLDMLFLDGGSTTNNTTGFRVDCVVTDTTVDQGRGNRLYNSVKFSPTESDNPVKAVLVTNNALTYATVTGTTLSYA